MSIVKIAAAKWRSYAKNIIEKYNNNPAKYTTGLLPFSNTERKFLETIDTSSRASGGSKSLDSLYRRNLSIKKKIALNADTDKRFGMTQVNQDKLVSEGKTNTLKHQLYYPAQDVLNGKK